MTEGSLGSIKVLQPHGAVDEPDEITVGVRATSRQILAREYPSESLALAVAADEKQHLVGRCEGRQGQRDPRNERREAGLLDADDPTLLLVERRAVGEQRSGVPVGAEP